MILRNGIHSTLRAKGRSALFTLLIFILTLALTLGLGMYAYSSQTLARMQEQYTSIALAEFMGTEYPDGDIADEYARQAFEQMDSAAIADVDGVKLWEPTGMSLAGVKGYRRASGDSSMSNRLVAVAYNFAVQSYEQKEMPWDPAEGFPGDYYVEEHTVESSAESVYLNRSWVNLHIRDEMGVRWDLEEVPLYYYTHWNRSWNTVWDDLDDAEIKSFKLEDMPGQFVSMEPGENGLYNHYLYIKDTGRKIPLDSYPLFYHELGGLEIVYTEARDPEKGIYWEKSVVPAEESWKIARTVPFVYRALVADCLYYNGDAPKVLYFASWDDTEELPREGRYLIHGDLTDSGGRLWYEPVELDGEMGCLPLSGTDDPALTDSAFVRKAAEYAVLSSYVQVAASDDVSALEEFQQGQLYLETGRFPLPGEENACVLGGDINRQLGLSVGDSIHITRLNSREQARYTLSVSEETDTWTVVGITNVSTDFDRPGSVWVSQAEGAGDQPFFGYNLGRAVLENTRAKEAAETIQELCPEGVRVTLYDQGYSAAAQPLEAMETTAMAITAASAVGALAVLFLFAYLFVGRQRETVEVLTSLGTSKGKVRLWLLSGAAVIAAVASLLGAVAGWGLLGVLLTRALGAAEALYAVDTRYSEAAMGVTLKGGQKAEIPGWPGPVAGTAVFLTALGLCMVFLALARRQSTPKRGKMKVRTPKGGTSTFGVGAGRFAFLSAKRGGRRSLVVPAATLALALLLGILVAGAQGWQDQMEELYGSARIEGQVTSLNGRQATNLNVSLADARMMYQSGAIEDLAVAKGWNYYILSDMPEFAGTSFGEERRDNWIRSHPKLYAVNSLKAAPGLYYQDAPKVEWLEGWDESFLASREYSSFLGGMTFSSNHGIFSGDDTREVYPCLMGRRYMEEHGLKLGDQFSAALYFEYLRQDLMPVLDVRIVGSYTEQGAAEIYVPLSAWMDPELLTREEDIPAQNAAVFDSVEQRDNYFYGHTNFSACRFTLTEPRRLEQLRNYLEEKQFSQVGVMRKNRTTVLLRDQSFVETVGGLGRYISFSKLLFPALFATVGLLGFVISWLMVNARRMEFAILRGLGASRRRVFWSFFLEQGGLCLAGCVLAGGGLTVAGVGVAGWSATAVFLGCYLLGCALSVVLVGRTNLMALLSERE